MATTGQPGLTGTPTTELENFVGTKIYSSFPLANRNYTVSQKTRHLTLAHNFTQCWPIFKILSLLNSVGKL